MLFWGHSLIMIKWEYGTFFPKMGEWLTYNYAKKVT